MFNFTDIIYENIFTYQYSTDAVASVLQRQNRFSYVSTQQHGTKQVDLIFSKGPRKLIYIKTVLETAKTEK